MHHRGLSCWKLSESLTINSDEPFCCLWLAHLDFLQEDCRLSIRSWLLSERSTYYINKLSIFAFILNHTNVYIYILFVISPYICSWWFNSTVATGQTQTYQAWWRVQITLNYLRIQQKYLHCFTLLSVKMLQTYFRKWFSYSSNLNILWHFIQFQEKMKEKLLYAITEGQGSFHLS